MCIELLIPWRYDVDITQFLHIHGTSSTRIREQLGTHFRHKFDTTPTRLRHALDANSTRLKHTLDSDAGNTLDATSAQFRCEIDSMWTRRRHERELILTQTSSHIRHEFDTQYIGFGVDQITHARSHASFSTSTTAESVLMLCRCCVDFAGRRCLELVPSFVEFMSNACRIRVECVSTLCRICAEFVSCVVDGILSLNRYCVDVVFHICADFVIWLSYIPCLGGASDILQLSLCEHQEKPQATATPAASAEVPAPPVFSTGDTVLTKSARDKDKYDGQLGTVVVLKNKNICEGAASLRGRMRRAQGIGVEKPQPPEEQGQRGRDGRVAGSVCIGGVCRLPAFLVAFLGGPTACASPPLRSPLCA